MRHWTTSASSEVQVPPGCQRDLLHLGLSQSLSLYLHWVYRYPGMVPVVGAVTMSALAVAPGLHLAVAPGSHPAVAPGLCPAVAPGWAPVVLPVLAPGWAPVVLPAAVPGLCLVLNLCLRPAMRPVSAPVLLPV